MRPDLVDIIARLVGKEVAFYVTPFYLALVLLGVLVGTHYGLRRIYLSEKLDNNYLLATIIGILGVFLGAKLLFTNGSGFNFSGVSLFGGAVGGALSIAGSLIVMGKPVLFYADAMAPGAALATAFARVGCFLAGCCHGTPTEYWWGISFPQGQAPWTNQLANGHIEADSLRSLPVHPTQLFEALPMLLVFIVLSLNWKRRTFDGQIVASLAILYGVVRFAGEQLRSDAQPLYWGIRGGLVLAAAVLFCGLISYLLFSNKAQFQLMLLGKRSS